MNTIVEKIKFGAFATFIAGCFAVGFYAGEGAAMFVSGSNGHLLEASNTQVSATSDGSSVRIEAIIDGRKVEKVIEGDSSVSVHVDGSKVFVNGNEVDLKDLQEPHDQTNDVSLMVEARANGAQGMHGKDGMDGASGEDGAPPAFSSGKDGEDFERDTYYPYLNELIAYVAYLFAF